MINFCIFNISFSISLCLCNEAFIGNFFSESIIRNNILETSTHYVLNPGKALQIQFIRVTVQSLISSFGFTCLLNSHSPKKITVIHVGSFTLTLSGPWLGFWHSYHMLPSVPLDVPADIPSTPYSLFSFISFWIYSVFV